MNKKVVKGEGKRQNYGRGGGRESEGRDDRRKLRGTHSEERARGDKGEERDAVSGMREDDAVGGTKLQLHCARWHLFRKENSSANNKRHAQMAHSFPYVLLLRYLSDALAPKSLMV